MADMDAYSEMDDSTKAGSDRSVVTITELKARILLVQKRRMELGPPEPTDKLPYPEVGSACRDCKREYRTCRNPLKVGRCEK